jgi:predicted RNA binding protein YcfA (HicA-like mRNA interferase family)
MKLPVIGARECSRALQKAGFYETRRESSHITLRHEKSNVRVTVPDHKTISPGTLRSIIRQAGLTVEEFIELL